MCYSKELSRLEDSSPLPSDVRQRLHRRLCSGSDPSLEDEDSWASIPQDGHGNKIDDPNLIFEHRAKAELERFLISVRVLSTKNQQAQSDYWDNIMRSLKEMLQTVYNKIVEALTWIKDTLSNAVQAVWDAIQRFFHRLQDFCCGS
ncbi:uncharacterized protein RHO17_002663 [Thomomys bottae]